jgi:hypothetical protein
LDCSFNQLESIPSLPSSLEYLKCDNNLFSLETPMLESETPQDYGNRLEEVQIKKRIIKRTREVKEEIAMRFWHPSNVQKLIDHYGIDFEDYV